MFGKQELSSKYVFGFSEKSIGQSCVQSCVRICVPNCVSNRVQSCVQSCIPSCVRICVPNYVRSCVRSCVQSCARSYGLRYGVQNRDIGGQHWQIACHGIRRVRNFHNHGFHHIHIRQSCSKLEHWGRQLRWLRLLLGANGFLLQVRDWQTQSIGQRHKPGQKRV